ncbi:nickel pincer cofactor biosynthesis protein LarB, partial [Streptomyces sp. NPDC054756]
MNDVLDLGYARLDLGREARQGLPEVVYGPGKTVEQIAGIVTGLLRHNTGPVLATRVAPETATAVLGQVEGGTYDENARLLTWRPAPAGVTVVNIDSGFSAAMAVHRIAQARSAADPG